jgi:beta-N-acetylhexosaminidase
MARCIVFSVWVAVLFGSACTSVANPEPPLAEPAQTSVESPSASADPIPPATTPSATEQATEVPEPTPTPTPLECLASWSVEEQIAQLLFPLVEQFQLSAVAELAAEIPFGGITVLGTPDGDLGALLVAAQAASAVPLIVAVDSEGGPVQRVARLVGSMPSARSMVSDDSFDVFTTYAENAAALGELGFTMNLAPVVDVGTAAPIGQRSFGDDVETVAAEVPAAYGGIQSAGLVPVLKHFPGHGSASADSHLGVSLTAPLDELRANDMVVFERLIAGGYVDPIMMGHLNVPGLTGDLPASLSAPAVAILRDDFGFDGLVMTDAMNMGAITAVATAFESTVLAINADVDLVMIASLDQVRPLVEQLTLAVGEGTVALGEIADSVVRVLAIKGYDPCDVLQ